MRPTHAASVTVADVYAARKRLLPHLTPTPLRHSPWLSSLSGAAVLLKLESVQPTNSFKIRGALNAALCLSERGERPTMVTASAGNHGQALAFAAARVGLNATVFTPRTAPGTKKEAIRRWGAALRDHPADYDAAEVMARASANETDALFISAYNHPDVIAGAGTVALELLDAAPDLDVVIVPMGGGGLVSGIALVFKHAKPDVRIIGVEVAASTAFSTSLAQGRIATVDVHPSLADGLIGNLEPDSITFDLVRDHVDEIVRVSEADLRDAMCGLVREEHLIAEGAGAAATAAVLSGRVPSKGRGVAVVVSGGNIDVRRLVEVLSASEDERQAGR